MDACTKSVILALTAAIGLVDVASGQIARPRVSVARLPAVVAFRSQAPLPDVARNPEELPSGAPQELSAAQSLEYFESLALANNPAVRRAAALVQAARGNWVQVGLPPNPVAGYLGSELGNDGRAGQQGGFVGQEFVRGGKLRLNRAVAAQEIRVAENDLAAMRLRVLTDTRQAFYDALAAQQRLEIASQLAELSNQGLRAAEGLFEGQQVAQVDVLQAQIEVDSAYILVENAKNDSEGAWRRLGAVTGIPALAIGRVQGDLGAIPPLTGLDEVWARISSNSPELSSAGALVARARQAVLRSRVEWVPNLEVQGGVQHDNASTDDIAFLQMGMPIPVWNRNQGAVVRAESELVGAQSSLERLRNELWHRLATTYQRYANAHQQASRYRDKILPNARRSLELVSGGYRQGQFSYLNLLTAQRTLFHNNLAYVESLRQLRRAEAEMQGFLLSGSLAGGSTEVEPSTSAGSPTVTLPLATDK